MQGEITVIDAHTPTARDNTLGYIPKVSLLQYPACYHYMAKWRAAIYSLFSETGEKFTVLGR